MDYKAKAIEFVTELPYRLQPYSSRNWGHPWHSLCSYHGKLKPAIASIIVNKFTSIGDVIVDPLCGVGTIPFEAALQGRMAIGNDLSEMAYYVTRAKLCKPDIVEVSKELEQLENYIVNNSPGVDVGAAIGFGYNGKISSYFHERTLEEVVCARNYFLQNEADTAAKAMLIACLLHILHGNRPYAISRRSHPLTPYSPTGEFIYKNLIEKLKAKVILSYSKGDWNTYKEGRSYLGDYSELPMRIGKSADAIITSPPFTNSIRFYTSNWLRLWFVGWNEEDFHKAESKFLEGKQRKNMDIYRDFFCICNEVLKPNGKLILHLGKSNKTDMAEELLRRLPVEFDYVYHGAEEVELVEKHGLRDKGATTAHQYLFLFKR